MKRGFVDPSEIARAYRDPLALASLGVDLLPAAAVFAFGWGATPLVALYWLENLVIGAFTALRMLGSVFGSAVKLAAALFSIPFFAVHYGMFCFVHGIFLRAFAEDSGDMPDARGLAEWAAGTAPQMVWFLGAIVAVNLLFLVFDFIGRGEFRRTDPMSEMFAPYGRIVTLHIAILLGAALTLALDEPLLGVLLIIVIRVVFGVAITVLRRRRREARVAAAPAPLGAPAA
jgi:hypothetical protein